MKKFILTLMVTLMTVFTSFAQNQTNYAQRVDRQVNYAGSSKFTDNVSVGIVGGVETNLNEWNAPQGAVAGIVLNKEISPLFGITLEGNTNINGLRNWQKGASHFYCANTFDGLSVYLTPRLNLTNAILGYKGSPRKLEVEAVAGPGYGFMLHQEYNALLVKAGLNFNYNVSDAFTITLRPAVIYNLHETAAQFDSKNAVGQLTAGIVYHFKNSNGTRSFNKAKLYDQNEVDMLNGKINALQKDLIDANATIEVLNNTLKKPLAPQTNATTVVKTVYPKVQFEQGSAKITPTSYANIYDIADALKDADGTIKITGYASTEGTIKFNKELSLKRAEAVKNALIKAGVAADKIETVAGGATNKFSPDELNVNRVVTTNE